MKDKQHSTVPRAPGQQSASLQVAASGDAESAELLRMKLKIGELTMELDQLRRPQSDVMESLPQTWQPRMSIA